MEADVIGSLVQHRKYTMNIATCLQELDASKAHCLHRSDDAKPYQLPPRCIVYALQEPFKKRWKD